MNDGRLAFLRGLNVGGHTVKKDELVAIFAEADFTEAATFLASGNVYFEEPGGSRGRGVGLSRDHRQAVESRLEEHLSGQLGYEVLTFVRTVAEVGAIAASTPFDDETPRDGDTLHVGFLKAPPRAPARRAVAAMSNDRDRLVVDGQELYWRIHGGVTDSSLKDKDVAAALGGPTTMRNMNTVRRLAAKYGP